MNQPSSTPSEAPQPGPYLPPWTAGVLPEAPRVGWKLWASLLGPGIVLAGTSIGSGEWLFGPAVSAQYGATLLWLASISILLQAFCNLMMMRYTLYCGEPILVGGLRTWPGPMSWVLVYIVLDIAAIWPFNASNAAVPLAAAILGHLPTEGRDVMIGLSSASWTVSEPGLVKALGFAIFVLSFVPLIFGGTVYRMLEKIMTLKLVLVLGYLSFVALFMVSSHNAWDVVTGFFRFGQVPLRAPTVFDGPNFSLVDMKSRDRIRGRIEDGEPRVAEFTIANGERIPLGRDMPDGYKDHFNNLVEQARAKAAPRRFSVESTTLDQTASLLSEGTIDADNRWIPERFISIQNDGELHEGETLDHIPEEFRADFEQLIANRGFITTGLGSYVAKHGRLPALDWAMLAAFAAIAGAGGLSNTMFSNYSRDKGWGMGAHVGAIPSAIGGRTISLSHVGEVFAVNASTLEKWRGWIRHIVRDQGIFVICSFLGMALPCMLSLEFIRNATVSSHAVAALTAEGMASRYPSYGSFFWTVTLLCGFLVLAPGQVSVGDQIARRWTDIIWTASRWAKNLAGAQVRYIYYSILSIYALWGLVTLSYFDPLQIAKIGTVLGNVALGVSCLQAWYANRVLLPKELQPHWFLQLGAAACGLFFLGITVVVVMTLR